MGLGPPQVAGLVGGVVFFQCTLACITCFFAQWTECRLTGIDEFSFGLQEILIRIGSLEKEFLLSDMAEFTQLFTKGFKNLELGSNICFGLCIGGMIMGILAGILAGVSNLESPMSKRQLFLAAFGLLTVDSLLVLIGLLVYVLLVMPSIREMNIGELAVQIAAKLDVEMDTGWKELFRIVGSCSNQSWKFSPYGVVLEVLLVVGVGLVVLVFGRSEAQRHRTVGAVCRVEGCDARTPSLQMQHIPQGGGGYGMPPPPGGMPPLPGAGGGYGLPPPPQNAYRDGGPGAARW